MARPLVAIGVRPLGGRDGTGRALIVTLEHRPTEILPDIVSRAEVALVPDHLPGRVYHAVADLERDAGSALVREVEATAARTAIDVLKHAVAAGGARGRPAGVALVVDNRSPEPPGDLETILSSHTLIHDAETALYRDVVAEAADAVGLPVVHQSIERLGTALAIAAIAGVDGMAETLADWGRVVGPPWRKEHKQAALAAWSLTAGSTTNLR